MATITLGPGVEFRMGGFRLDLDNVLTQTASQYEWTSTPSSSRDPAPRITLFGQFTYDASGNVSGDVALVNIDVNNDGIEDFSVSYSSFQPIAAELTSGDANTFFNALMAQSDDISVVSAYDPLAGRFPFLEIATDGLFVLAGETKVGAADTFTASGDETGFGFDGTLVGDFRTVRGTAQGADDTFTIEDGGGAGMIGDVVTAEFGSSVTGGHDTFTASAGARIGGLSDSMVGDVAGAYGDLTGGNDVIDLSAAGDSGSMSIYGDAIAVGSRNLGEAVTFVGGNDTITLAEGVRGRIYGDAGFFGDNAEGTFTGGNDTLIGGGRDDTIFGDYDSVRVFGNPTISIVGGDDVLRGNGGDDELYGNEGDDELYGGADSDRLFGGDGDDELYGNSGNDTLKGGAGNDIIDGGSGGDTVDYSDAFFGLDLTLAEGAATVTVTVTVDGTDTLIRIENVIGTLANDTITGNSLYNILEGGGGNDVLDGAGGLDTVSYRGAQAGVTVDLTLQGAQQNTGGGGLDTLFNFERVVGSDFDDTIRGDGGDNEITWTGGNDIVAGRGGNDTLVVEADLVGEVLDLASTATQTLGTSGSLTLSGFENVSLEGGRSLFATVLGTNGANRMIGGERFEIFDGRGGIDYFDGGDGFDRVVYSSLTGALDVDLVADTASFDGIVEQVVNIEFITASQGDTTVLGDEGTNLVTDIGESDDTFDGGDGVDTYSYEEATAGVTAYLQFTGRDTGGAGRDTLISVENLTGSAFDDRLVGDDGANYLKGGAGNDIIKLKGGTDNRADGGEGDDRIRGSEGVDALFGQGGRDILVGLDGDDRLSLGGAEGGFAYGGKGNDNVSGGEGDDVLRGNRGDDVLIGFAGNDDTRGGGGDDTVRGDRGDNYLLGGNGADTIVDGRAVGNDVMTGGFGGQASADGDEDVFVFAQRRSSNTQAEFDRIKDFEDGIDKIDLSSFSNFATFSDVLAVASDYNATIMRLDLGNMKTLFVEDFQVADLTADDLILG